MSWTAADPSKSRPASEVIPGGKLTGLRLADEALGSVEQPTSRQVSARAIRITTLEINAA